jgi:hypothetical protein
MNNSRHIRYQPSVLPLVPAPVALMQELVREDASADRVAKILAEYPPDELRVMAAQLAEMAELVNDYADRKGVQR